MSYTAAQFKHCLFNPFEEKLFATYPQLESIVPEEEEVEELDEEAPAEVKIDDQQVMRYVIALYDPGSPLVKSESSLVRRKEIAAEIAGLEDDETSVLIDCAYPKAVLMAQNFLREFARSMEWAHITSLEETFWEYNTRLKLRVTMGKADRDLIAAVAAKTQLAKDAKDILVMYRAEIATLFQDDKQMIDAVSKRRGFTPEKMAKR